MCLVHVVVAFHDEKPATADSVNVILFSEFSFVATAYKIHRKLFIALKSMACDSIARKHRRLVSRVSSHQLKLWKSFAKQEILFSLKCKNLWLVFLFLFFVVF